MEYLSPLLVNCKSKKEAIEEHKLRDIKQRVETAEALAKAGVITKQDLDNIKKESEKELSKLKEDGEKVPDSDQSKRNKATSQDKIDDETGKKD